MNVNFQQLDCFAARLICDEPVLANIENLIILEIQLGMQLSDIVLHDKF